MKPHFDLTDLRLMVKIAEANSVTGGAEALHLSTPAASTRIKNLEEGIGARLLVRTPQGVTLTPPGQAVVHHARLVLSQLEHLSGDLQEYARGVKGHLRVWASATAMGEFLPPVLQTYLRAHPDVNIDLRERLSFDIVRAVGEGKIDIGIVSGFERTETLQVIPYRRDRLVLVVPPGHALAREPAVMFSDSLAFDHIGLAEGSALRAFLQRQCDELHRTLQLRIEVSGFEIACRMIAAGVGVGVMPESAARRQARTLAIAIVPLRDDWSLRAQHVCVRQLAALPGFAQDLVALLVADAASVPAVSNPS
ncbi:MAG TPA: LysR substrate-binding domain-containing protein [Burkholderiaceae bacterium]